MVASVQNKPGTTPPPGATGTPDDSARSAPAGKPTPPRSPRSASGENPGFFENMKTAGKKFAESMGFAEAKFSHVNELTSIDAATQVEILQEIRNGTPVSPERARLHKIVNDYLDHQLKAKSEITPGICATGFSHVRVAISPSGVIEDGWTCNAMSDIKNSILDASIAYASNPEGTPPADVFTFHQIITQQSPTKDDSLFPTGPMAGVDGYGNKRMVMPLGGAELARLNTIIDHHHDKQTELGSDPMAWQRAAWLAALSQIPLDQLDARLVAVIGGEHLEVIHRIVEMAAAIQEGERKGEGVEQCVRPVQTADGKQTTFKLKYPDETPPIQHDCESDLNKLTGLILKDVRNNNDGQSLLDADHQGYGIYALTLLNKLGVHCVVLDQTNVSENSSRFELSVSSVGCKDIASAKSAKENESVPLANIVDEYACMVPVVEISKNGIVLKLHNLASDQAAGGAGQQNAGPQAGGGVGDGADDSTSKVPGNDANNAAGSAKANTAGNAEGDTADSAQANTAGKAEGDTAGSATVSDATPPPVQGGQPSTRSTETTSPAAEGPTSGTTAREAELGPDTSDAEKNEPAATELPPRQPDSKDQKPPEKCASAA